MSKLPKPEIRRRYHETDYLYRTTRGVYTIAARIRTSGAEDGFYSWNATLYRLNDSTGYNEPVTSRYYEGCFQRRYRIAQAGLSDAVQELRVVLRNILTPEEKGKTLVEVFADEERKNNALKRVVGSTASGL